MIGSQHLSLLGLCEAHRNGCGKSQFRLIQAWPDDRLIFLLCARQQGETTISFREGYLYIGLPAGSASFDGLEGPSNLALSSSAI